MRKWRVEDTGIYMLLERYKQLVRGISLHRHRQSSRGSETASFRSLTSELDTMPTTVGETVHEHGGGRCI